MKTIVLIAVFLLSLASHGIAAERFVGKAPAQTAQVTQLGATWRSALIPGWGQWYRGDTWRGVAYLATVAASLGLSYSYNTSGDASYAKYLAATTPADATAYYNQATQQDQMWAVFAYTAAGLYAVNLADAWFFTKESAPRITLQPNRQGNMLVALNWKY